MSKQERVILEKSDKEQIFDLLTTAMGLAVLAYMTHPDPFDKVIERLRAYAHAWFHRVSVWEAIQAIRSLPETEE